MLNGVSNHIICVRAWNYVVISAIRIVGVIKCIGAGGGLGVDENHLVAEVYIRM